MNCYIDLQSGCCKPSTDCNFQYVSPTNWTRNQTSSLTNPDCSTWSNDPNVLCYNCQSCKAGMLDNIKTDWKRVAIINVIFLVFLIIVYSVGCCAFRNNREDNAWKRYPWSIVSISSGDGFEPFYWFLALYIFQLLSAGFLGVHCIFSFFCFLFGFFCTPVQTIFPCYISIIFYCLDISCWLIVYNSFCIYDIYIECNIDHSHTLTKCFNLHDIYYSSYVIGGWLSIRVRKLSSLFKGIWIDLCLQIQMNGWVW